MAAQWRSLLPPYHPLYQPVDEFPFEVRNLVNQALPLFPISHPAHQAVFQAVRGARNGCVRDTEIGLSNAIRRLTADDRDNPGAKYLRQAWTKLTGRNQPA